MDDPSMTRIVGIPGYLLLWLLTVGSVVLFGRRALCYVATLRAARSENRLDNLPRRVGRFLAHVLVQPRLLREPVIGIAHLLIFWAFVFYAVSFFWNLLRGALPFTPIPYADEVAWMATALQFFGFIGLASLVVAAARRYLFPPSGLEQSRDAGVILSLIAIVLVTSLIGSSARGQSPRLALGMWWLHMITVLGFLAYLPYSKHLHLLASPFGVLFGSLDNSGMPPSSEGASRREEFTWRELFSGLACAECGRCERACPAFQSGEPLSPKVLMHHFKELVRGSSPGTNGRAFVGDIVSAKEVWACRACRACMDVCPVFNEHIPLVVEMRRHLISQGEVDVRLQTALTNLTRYGNSYGTSPRARAKWTQGIDFRIKDARKEAVDYLWFVGDYASFDPRLAQVTQATARLLRNAGIDFGILFDGEQNSGNDVRRLGEEGLAEMLREKNQAALSQVRCERIVTTDPHSFQALKCEYGDGRGDGSVLHYTELIDELIRDGRLTVRQPLSITATYHDPCYLGRYNGIYDAPRRILRELGVTLVEMKRNRSSSYCCGAGGGKIWMEDALGSRERPAENRMREAAGLPGVDTLVVSCPKDLVMFQDALKTTGLEGRIVVKDMIDLVDQASRPSEERT